MVAPRMVVAKGRLAMVRDSQLGIPSQRAQVWVSLDRGPECKLVVTVNSMAVELWRNQASSIATRGCVD